MKLLLDEMLQRVIAEQLRARGHDVVAVTERPDLRRLADEDLFAQANRENRAVVTYNRDDFISIHRQHVADRFSHHSVVIVGPHAFPEGRSTGQLVTALNPLITGGQPYPDFLHWLR